MILEQPAWFWLSAGAVPLAIFFALAFRARRNALARFLGDASPERLSSHAGRDRRAFEAAAAALTIGILALVLAGPHWGRSRTSVHRKGADVVIVLDASRSMLAQDILPSRLERARREIRGLLESSPGSRVALVTFAGDARLVCPLTVDHDTVSLFLDEIDPMIDHRGGSSLTAALNVASQALEASAGAGRAIVVLTDGEDPKDPTGRAAAAIASRLAARGIEVHAIGLGLPGGAKIPVVDDRGVSSFFKDARGAEVITKLSAAPLDAIAEAAGGRHLLASRVAFPMEELLKSRISRLAQGSTGEHQIDVANARYQWFLALALLSACAWWGAPFVPIPKRAARGPAVVHREKTSDVFSRAAVVLLVLLVPSHARAGAADDGAEGDALYRKGDYDAAAAAYEKAARGTETEHAPFNLGNARFRQGKFRAAAKSWSDAERRAVEPSSRRDASYNRGVALLKAAETDSEKPREDLESAIKAFDDALRHDPTDADARHNRAIAIARWVADQKSKEKGSSSEKKNEKRDKTPGSEQSGQQAEGSPQSGSGEEKGETKEKEKGEGGEQGEGPPKEGEAPPGEALDEPATAAEMDRLERLLDAQEKEQRRFELQKRKMHRNPGEHEW